MQYDSLLKGIGEFGPYHRKICLIIFLAGIPNAFFVVSFAFTQFKTGFRCHRNHNNTIYHGVFNSSSGGRAGVEITWRSNECDIDSNHGYNVSVETVPCPFGWDYQDNNTVVAEFNLVCGNDWKAAFAATLYMLGMTTGALTASLCDRFGRRPMYLLYSYVQFAAAGFTGNTWNFESYCVGTFVMGLCGFAGYNIAITLSTEIMPPRRQGLVAAINLFSYITGFMLTPLISFLLPNWRWYLRFCGFVGIVYFLPLYWFFPESLRWLVISGRTKEAKKLSLKIAKDNGKSVDAEDLFKDFQSCSKAVEDGLERKDSSLIRILSRSPTLRGRLLTLYYSWATAALLYFAISLNPVSPGSNRYIHIILVGLAEIPGYIFGYFVWRHLGLAWCLISSSGLAGIACIMIPFLLSSSTVVLGSVTFIGKCFCSCFYAYITVVVGRIAPTLVRHSAVTTASAIGKIGALIMPYLMYTGDSYSHNLPYFVMGCMTFISTFLIFLFIPDTRNDVPDTVSEAEANQSNYLNILRKGLKERKQEVQCEELEEKSNKLHYSKNSIHYTNSSDPIQRREFLRPVQEDTSDINGSNCELMA